MQKLSSGEETGLKERETIFCKTSQHFLKDKKMDLSFICFLLFFSFPFLYICIQVEYFYKPKFSPPQPFTAVNIQRGCSFQALGQQW